MGPPEPACCDIVLDTYLLCVRNKFTDSKNILSVTNRAIYSYIANWARIIVRSCKTCISHGRICYRAQIISAGAQTSRGVVEIVITLL